MANTQRPDQEGVRKLHHLTRWMYRGGSPNLLARGLNRISAVLFAAGRLGPDGWITLEVRGRRSGRAITFPLVAVSVDKQRYIVSMLGTEAGWVKNLRTTGMRAVVCRRGRHAVRLEDVPIEHRAPILREYLHAAPGARPHFPIDRYAPLGQFEQIADQYPVLRMVPEPGSN